MNRFAKAALSLFCTTAVMMSGVAVFADETDITPTGIKYEDIGSEIEHWAEVNPDEYVSFVTAVFDGDEILYQGAFGYYDRESNIPVQEDSVYEWGSVSKLLVWVSVMQLYEQGRLDLEEDIRTYLPSGFLKNLKYDDPITMLNLMNHDAGWGEGTWAVQVSSSSDVVPLGEALQQTEPPQMYRPGEVASYSNWGAALAGYIVECITGQSYSDYVHENIFAPLGMEHTAILPDHSDNAWVKQNREALVSYHYDGSAWNENGHQLVYINLYPAGAATGTIHDMALFAQSFVSDDNLLFEKVSTRDILLYPSSYLGETNIPVCCHGFWPDSRENVNLTGHNGGTNACSSLLAFDRDTGLGMVYMTAGSNADIDTIIFGNPKKPDLSNYAAPVTSDISGIYTGTRSIRRGIFKISGILEILPVTSTGSNEYDVAGMAKITQISDNLLILNQDEYEYAASTYVTSDGTRIISLGSQSFALDKMVLPSLVLLALFVIITIVGFFMLIFKLIGLISKKINSYKGALLVTLSQIFRIPVLLPVILLAVPYTNNYGLTKAQGYIFFGVEAACFIVFSATLISSFLNLISKNEEAWPKARYVMSVLGNLVSMSMMIFMEFLIIRGI